MKKYVDVMLGDEDELKALFSYYQFFPAAKKEEKKKAKSAKKQGHKASTTPRFTDFLAHAFNQTVLRDEIWGAWADVYYGEDDQLGIRIGSPTEDVSGYADVIPRFIEAGRAAYELYLKQKKKFDKLGFRFTLPFGMSMLKTKSIQLLHYPPMEAFSFIDYLYSNTNRRWESLLVLNGYDGSRTGPLERCVDAVPIAAPGGELGQKEIAEYNTSFIPYGQAMLRALLDGTGRSTQPVVAYSAALQTWLLKAYREQVKDSLEKQGLESLEYMSLVQLHILDGGARTPVLCAHHPSEFLFILPGKPIITEKQADKHVYGITQEESDENDRLRPRLMRDDLVAAGWQARMAEDWDTDPFEVLKAVRKRWSDDDEIESIMRDQVVEFSYPEPASPGRADADLGGAKRDAKTDEQKAAKA